MLCNMKTISKIFAWYFLIVVTSVFAQLPNFEGKQGDGQQVTIVEFDFCSDPGSGGGSFQQQINEDSIITVGNSRHYRKIFSSNYNSIN